MVIVDSTVWTHYLRTPETPIGHGLLRLLEADQVVMVGVVLAEVLQGARGEREFRQLRSWLEVLPYLEVTQETWAGAGELSMHLRAEGRLTPLTDLLIAALALEGDHHVYTLDEHFQRVPGLRLYHVEAD